MTNQTNRFACNKCVIVYRKFLYLCFFLLLLKFLVSSVLQVVGKKYIRLYPSSLQDELYPYSETMLCNSSQVSFFNIIFKSDTLFKRKLSRLDPCVQTGWFQTLVEGWSWQHWQERVPKGGGARVYGLYPRGRRDVVHPSQMVALCQVFNNEFLG